MSETSKASSKMSKTEKVRNYFPIRVAIPPNKSRLMFFTKEED